MDDTFSTRLNTSIEIKGCKQIDIVNNTGITKGALSSYLAGRYKPKNKMLKLLADYLEVNKEWLDGYLDALILGRRIQKRRELMNITVDNLSFDSGLSIKALLAAESGKYFPNNDKLIMLAVCLETTTEYLMGITDDSKDYKYIENVLQIPSSFARKHPNVTNTELLKIWQTSNDDFSQYFTEYTAIPVYGSISCGNGGFNDDLIEEYVNIPSRMLRDKHEYFSLYASGDSMKGENINEGDLIIFYKTSILSNGDIGCFCIDENTATCKKYKKDDSNDIIWLIPANDDYDPIMITVENTNFHIIGKLALVLNDRQ